MQLRPGQPLGPYEIVEKIGEGGMGAVYRARDTRLNRFVAIKILSEDLSGQPRARERLTREARAISALSHPNICALHDIGHEGEVNYLVMEFLDGEGLATRLARGPLPLKQVLKFGADIAAALDAAHRSGVIHRDLKPGNVILTSTGATLVDFGLAKTHEVQGATDAVTAKAPLTEPGAVVGTLAYMSPEQIAGQRLDPRTDIFSLGTVLYEMVSGRRPFDGPSRASVIATIMNSPPPPLPASLPHGVDRVISKCLEKNPEDRWQSARDLRDELLWLADQSASSRPEPVAPRRSKWMWIAAIVLLGALLAAIVYIRRGRQTTEAPSVRFGINPPAGAAFSQRAINTEIAVSPDGRRIVFSALRGGKRALYIRPLDALTARQLEGTEGGFSPFWSPDSKWIGFFARGMMMKMAASGGPPQAICRAHGGSATWSVNGTILFAEWGPSATEGVESVSADGGAPSVISSTKGWHFWPSFLSDGKHYLFSLNGGSKPSTGLYLASVDDKTETRLLTNTSRAEATSDNTLYFVRDGILMKQRLDLRARKMLGEAVAIAEPAFAFLPTGHGNFNIDADGDVVAYQRVAAPTLLVWRDRDGHETGRLRSSVTCRNFRISPDGRRVAIEQFEAATEVSNIWMYDLDRDAMTRVTTNRYGTYCPLWSSDGRELVVSDVSATGETNPPQLARLSLDSGQIRELMRDDGVEFASAMLPDGKGVMYTVDRGDQKDIEILSMSGDRKHVPVIASPQFNESGGVLSPDGSWIAFQSDQSGQPEVYIRPFGTSGETIAVSSEGGIEPRWSHRGDTLYFVGATGILMRVSVAHRGNSLDLGRPVPLFPITSAGMMEQEELGLTHYDIAPDDQHFLVREMPGGTDESPVIVIVSPRR